MCFLQKLHSFGICQNTFKWFHSYPANRKQRVSWRDMLSHEKDISSGVPHKSILRSSFFNLYRNDYSKCVKHSSVTMCADGTS